jgi:hypothetical protein
MPYNLNFFDGRSFITLSDGVVDQQASSSLYLIGKDVTSYGTYQNDNFLWLLENFAGTIEPVNKVQGQIWYDKNTGILKPKIYDGGEWRSLALLTTDDTASTNATLGDLWYNSVNDQLFVKNTLSNYTLIGPEKVVGYGKTRMSSTEVLDTSNEGHACIIMYVDGVIVGAMSNDEFDVKSSEEVYLAGITHIGKGFSLVSGAIIASDSVYASQPLDEVITGHWTFTDENGISINSATIFTTESGDLTLQSAQGQDLVIDADYILPFSVNSIIGSSSKKFAKVYTSEINAGSSITSINLTGKYILTSGSKLEPGVDGTIALGAANARWSTVCTKAINSGGNTEEAQLVGTFKLNADSTLDLTAGAVSINSLTAQTSLRTSLLTTGAPSTYGEFIGQWHFKSGSSLTFDNGSNLSIGSGANFSLGAGANFSLGAGTQLTATYADIAEKYSSDQDYEPGTVVMFGGTKEVTISSFTSTPKVAGVVTTNPAQILNSELEDSVAIALVGRVPCKVTGKIEKGDLLVTSHIPGVATTSDFPRPGSLVAKALEDYNSIEVGVIEVMVLRG